MTQGELVLHYQPIVLLPGAHDLRAGGAGALEPSA